MLRRTNLLPARLAVGALAACGVLLGVVLAPRPAPAQALSGFDVYRTHCGGCHELYDPEDPKRTRKEWDTIVVRMIKERGATLNKQEVTAVLNYLDSFNRPPRQIRWLDQPAKSRKAALTAQDAGKLPAEWVDLTLGTDQLVPWAVQADASGKAFYLSPLKAAGENQYPALIDNTGLVEDGSASTRIQIVSGKNPVGAGILFGYRNTQAFYGVRISPRDVVLYEVNGGQRALLARAPLALPNKQWHALTVSVKGKQVTIAVNGKPLGNLTRTLNGYQGGRLGLHTQGDTVALFDQWQVEVQ